MIKQNNFYILVGLLVGILVTPFIFRAFWWPSVEDITRKVADRLSIEVPTATPVIENYQPGFWQKIVAEGSLSSVGVETNGRVYGGIVLSADGLIATVSDVVGSKANVLIGEESYPADIVLRDKENHVAILKIDYPNLIASPIDVLAPIQPGVEMVLVGKIKTQSDISTFVKEAIVSYLNGLNPVLDISPASEINGAKAINDKGKVIGIGYVKSGQVTIISSEAISEALNNYLESVRN